MSKTVVYNYYESCPVCGEIEDYKYLAGSAYEPSPDEAYCSVCQWVFVETSQHYPTLKSINDYRCEEISNAKKYIKRLEKQLKKQIETSK